MSHDEGTVVQSLKATLPLYVTETRDAAETITTFATNTAAQQLGSVLQGSASAVEQGIVELSNNANRVVKILNEENQMLRAELLKTWQVASTVAVDTVAEVENAQRSENAAVSKVVQQSLAQVEQYFRSLQMHSSEGAEAATRQLSELVQELAEANATLEAEKKLIPLQYVPRSVYDATEFRCQQLTQELESLTRSMQSLGAQLDEARALSHTQSLRSMSTPGSLEDQQQQPDRRSSPGAAASELSGAAHQISLLGGASGSWKAAIRQLEEQAALAVSHKIQSTEVDALRAEQSRLQQQNESLEVELRSARQMMKAMEQDVEVQRSLKVKLQDQLRGALEAAPFTEVSRLNVRSHLDASIPLAPPGVMRLPSLQPASNVQPLGRVQTARSNRTAAEDSVFNVSVMSPPPRSVQQEGSPQVVRHRSVEQLIDENQSLYKQVLELQRPEQWMQTVTGGGDRKRARSERAPSTGVVTTCDVGTSTDAVMELTSRFASQHQTPLPSFYTDATRTIATAHSSASARLAETMLGTTSQLHATQIRNMRQFETTQYATMKEIVTNAVTTSIANHAKATQLEQQTALLKEQRDHLIDDLLVRDVSNHSCLTVIASTMQRALETIQANAPQALSPTQQSTELSAPNAALDGSSIIPLMESLTQREEALGDLVRNAPKVAALWTAATRTPAMVDAERTQQALAVAQEELQTERARVKKLLDQAHVERTKHIALLDRLWQSEETAKESTEETALLRQQLSTMLTEDQFHELQSRCNIAEQQLQQDQLQLEALMSDNARLVDEYQRCEARTAEMQMQHHQMMESLRAEVSSLSVVVQSGAQMLQAERREREAAAHSASRFQSERDSIRSKLHFTESQLEQARVALLSQLPTIELLKSLFPGGSMEDAMSDRLNRFAVEIQRLQQALTTSDSKLVQERRAIVDLMAQKQEAEVERQRLNALWRSSMLNDAADEQSARHQLHELTLQVQTLEHEVSVLTQERDLLKSREDVYEERIATLANDPISYNARKYGLERTKTIQEQLELVDRRCKELSAACDNLSSQKQQAESACDDTKRHLEAVQQAKSATEVELSQLQHAADALQQAMQQEQQSNSALQEQLTGLQSDIQSKSALVSSQSVHIAATEKALETVQAAVAVGDKQRDGLITDNLALTEEIRKLKQLVMSLETERKEQAIALRNAQLRQHVQQQGGSSQRSGTAMHGNSSVGASSSFQDALLKKGVVLKQR